jgi:hypothetical protein
MTTEPTPADTPTPRTDAATDRAQRCGNHSGAIKILSPVAAQLERELTAALADNARLREEVASMKAKTTDSKPLWGAPLREKLDRLAAMRCLCGGTTGFSSDIGEIGDAIPDIGIEECADCGALWDFGQHNHVFAIRGPLTPPTEHCEP